MVQAEPGTPAGDEKPPGQAGLRARLRRSRKWPPNWPIRWKLTAVSAGLTFLILVIFGAAIGQIATSRLREMFRVETVSKAEEVAQELRVMSLSPGYVGSKAEIDGVIGNVNNPVELLSVEGYPFIRNSNTDLGPALLGPGVINYGHMQVATVQIVANSQTPVGWLRFGRSTDSLNVGIAAVRINILTGVLVGTLLAALGSVILSRRALRPISTLTATAGEIAKTRDPEVRLEPPASDDEVAELTRTFSAMLHELALSREEEERLLRRQREFVADASHELRTPLTSVLANLEMLEESLRGEADEDDIASVESALRSSRRMRRLVSDLQTLARIDVLRDAAFSRCDLSQIARDAVTELEPLLGSRSIVAEIEGPAPVRGAEDDLHRVAVNLIGNAIRHAPEETQIEVSTSVDSPSRTVTLSVADDGPGIPPEMRSQIFGRFVRSSGSIDRSKGKGRGTGLGLAIVKATAERHGGSVEVGESRLGGAKFTVTLPLCPEDA